MKLDELETACCAVRRIISFELRFINAEDKEPGGDRKSVV